MSSPRVIVFGATGDVGSITARVAHDKGASVILAVRNLKKPVPGLDFNDESSQGFERVFADMDDSNSIHAAVTKSRATRAFLYLSWGQSDGMELTVSTLKQAGITEVVFLSSSSVPDDKTNVSMKNLIGLLHGKVEINLEKHFGDRYAAVRPAYFASNAFGWKDFCKNGRARIPYPQAVFDWISASDIGLVCGTLLAGSFPVSAPGNFIRLEGPKLLSQGLVLRKIGQAAGKDVVVDSMSHEEAVDFYTNTRGLARAKSEGLVNALREKAEENATDVETGDATEGARNILKYGGRDATTVDAWIEENLAVFRTWDL